MDPSANREYDFIDGLRGLAILMVLACHSFYAKTPDAVASRFLLNFAGTLGSGVGLFFTLSGFLISWPFWKRKVNRAGSLIPPGYGWRRFWKIYPPLALSVLLLTPCYILWLGQAPLFLRTAGEWLTGLAFLMPVSGQLNPVMWSLVVEIHFYLILPLLFLLTKPLSAKTCLWLISLFIFAVPVSIQALTGLAPMFAPEIYDPFCTGLSYFCFGVCVAGIDNLKLWNPSWGRLGRRRLVHHASRPRRTGLGEDQPAGACRHSAAPVRAGRSCSAPAACCATRPRRRTAGPMAVRAMVALVRHHQLRMVSVPPTDDSPDARIFWPRARECCSIYPHPRRAAGGEPGLFRLGLSEIFAAHPAIRTREKIRAKMNRPDYFQFNRIHEPAEAESRRDHSGLFLKTDFAFAGVRFSVWR